MRARTFQMCTDGSVVSFLKLKGDPFKVDASDFPHVENAERDFTQCEPVRLKARTFQTPGSRDYEVTKNNVLAG